MRTERSSRWGVGLLVAGALAWVAAGAAAGAAQERVSRLGFRLADGGSAETPLQTDRGFAAFGLESLAGVGWTVEDAGEAARAVAPDGRVLEVRAGTPFFRWDGGVLQLADAPYADRDRLLVPAQLVADFLPRWYPDLYDFRPEAFVLRAGAGGGTLPAADAAAPPAAEEEVRPPENREEERPADVVPPAPARPELAAPSPYEGVRVVVIDAGHGGRDPGTLGPGGIREKDVALAIALHMAEALRADSRLEVHMIRDDDTFVPVWDRGQRATDLKGDRPGVLVSIHANSFPQRRAARGFETYFLSEARTEHERRVAALENAPLQGGGDAEPGDDLSFILRELRNLDQQHWSALLAEYMQDEIAEVHPGPNRGVKQAPLAVMTNALMPAVLVEIGYLSNRDEARVLAQSAFQDGAADALAQAVLRFFERYPPEGGLDGGGARR